MGSVGRLVKNAKSVLADVLAWDPAPDLFPPKPFPYRHVYAWVCTQDEGGDLFGGRLRY